MGICERGMTAMFTGRLTDGKVVMGIYGWAIEGRFTGFHFMMAAVMDVECLLSCF